MQKLSVDKLKAGMVLEKAIMTKTGQAIARAGTELTEQMIARFTFYRIPFVYVTDASVAKTSGKVKADNLEFTEAVQNDVVEVKKEEEPAPKASAPRMEEIHSYSQKLLQTPEFRSFQSSYTKDMVLLRGVFEQLINHNEDAVIEDLCRNLLKEVEDLFASKTSLELFDMLHTLRAVDDSVYAHCLNVALIARAIGKWLQIDRSDLDELTIAGLVHDIGKAMIPEEVLNKQGKLTDEEFDLIKSHAKLGYSILVKTGITKRIQLAALQHHERFDGSGYPRGLEGDEIDYFASIIAIADVYDAMTAARSYRAPKCAFQVIAAFEEDGLQKYNPKVILTFLNRVAGCYNNSRVMLSDGTTGRVVFLNKEKLSRPIIETDGGELIDLTNSKHKEVFIKSIL